MPKRIWQPFQALLPSISRTSLPLGRLIGALVLAADLSFAGGLTFGVVGGIPLTVLLQQTPTADTYGQNYAWLQSSPMDRYMGGASLGYRFRGGLSLEAEALYRRFSYQDEFVNYDSLTGYTVTQTDQVSAGDWEFPLRLKYAPNSVPRLLAFPENVHPYITGGAAIDVLRVSNSYAIGAVSPDFGCVGPCFAPGYSYSGTNSTPTGLQHKNVVGVVAGAGIDIRCGPVHISPEIRFTRWTREHFSDTLDNSAERQLEFLVGVSR